LSAKLRDLFAVSLDKEAKREENRHKAEMNKLKEQAGQQKILADQISMLRNLGYEDEEIDVAVKALLDPLTQMSELSNKKKISLKTPNKSL